MLAPQEKQKRHSCSLHPPPEWSCRILDRKNATIILFSQPNPLWGGMLAPQASVGVVWWLTTSHNAASAFSVENTCPERFGAILISGWAVMTSVMKLVMKSRFMTIYVNFQSWTQLLLTVTVTRGHDGFPGEFRGCSRPDSTTVKPWKIL